MESCRRSATHPANMCGCAIDTDGERNDAGTQTSKMEAGDAIRIMLAPQSPSSRDYSSRLLTVYACCGVTFPDDRSQSLERAKGIEPSYAAWEAAVLPLNYTRKINYLSLFAVSVWHVSSTRFGGTETFPTPASVLQSRRQTELWLPFADAGRFSLPPRFLLHAPNEVGPFEPTLIPYVRWPSTLRAAAS